MKTLGITKKPTAEEMRKNPKMKPVTMKKEVHKSRRLHINATLLAFLMTLAISAFVLKEFPELGTKYPALFWAAKIFVQFGELSIRLYKLVLQCIIDLLPFPGHTIFQNWWSNLTSNWGMLKEAFWTLLKLIA